MSEFKILIYEKDVLDIDLFKYLCKQLKMEIFCADTLDKAHAVLKKEDINFAIVNFSMQRLNLKKDIKVIATGKPDQTSGIRVLQYFPVSFIPKPISISSISLGLLRAIGDYLESASYISSMVNINEFLKDLKFKLSSFINDENSTLTFLNSVDKFCKNICKFSENETEVNKDDFASYTVLDYFSTRGVIYCKYRKTCKLWSFVEHLKEVSPDQADKTPFDGIKKISVPPEHNIFFDALEFLISKYDDEIDKLYELKLNYCRAICSDRKEDLEFLKNDNIFSTARQMMDGDVVYCTYHSCPLDNFYELFKKKII